MAASSGPIPPMLRAPQGRNPLTQATIVALYGDKPAPLRDFFAACQTTAAAALGVRFRPYPMAQIHGTLIGLEREQGAAGPVNRNFLWLRQRQAALDFAGILRLVRGAAPFQVRIGGFAEDDAPFLSRGARPFARGFSVQGPNVVIMGWPVASGRPGTGHVSSADKSADTLHYPATLAGVRRSAEQCGALHAYHGDPLQQDNDFYLRIGTLDGPLDDGAARRTNDRLRRWLAGRPPLFRTITLADLAVAVYRSPELPGESTEAFRLDVPAVSAAFLRDRLQETVG
mgnify:CR=1 FL=1